MRWAHILRHKLIPAAAVLTAAIFFLDLLLPLGVAGGVPYVVLVIIGWWFEKTRNIFVLAAISSTLIVAGYFLSEEGGIAWMVLTNRFLALSTVWVTAILLAKAKHADMARRDSEERFSAVINSMPAKFHIKDLAGRYLLINKVTEELFGVTDAEARGKTTHEIFPGKRADAFRAHDQAVSETGQTIAEEEEWQREDGIHTFHTVTFPFRDTDGRITAIGAIGTDVTEKRRLEAEREQEREQLRAILDGMFAFVGLYSLDGTLVEANRAPLEAAKLSREDVIGKPFWNAYWWSYSAKTQEQVRTALHRAAEGAVVREDFLVRLSKSKFITIDAMFVPLRGDDGCITGIVGSGVDITERLQVEDQLRESRRRLVEAQRIAHIGSWELDLIKDTLTWSDEIYRIFEIDPKRFGASYESFLNAIHPDDRAMVNEAYQGSLVDRTAYEVKHRLRMLDGRIKRVKERCETVFDADGKPLISLGTVQDVTDQWTAEEAVYAAKEAAEIANRTKSEFLATMSHELRTPLNAILGFSEIIGSETFGPIGNATYRDYAVDIHGSGQHLLDLVNDILDLSKVESGMEELQEEDVDIPVVADSVLRLVWQRAEKHRVELSLEVLDEPPGLRADKRKLKQILVNLLSNAIKFTEAGGEVTLKIWCHSDSGYIFQIVDTGIGMAPEDIPKALSQFGQVDSDLNRKYQGTGLGLPLTKALVELHGGCLDVQSQVGVGTTVTIRFPAARIMRSQQETRLLGMDDREAS